MNAQRKRLPNRRASRQFTFICNAQKYIATVSFFADGRLAEIFIGNAKGGSHSDSAAKDSAVVCSIALQYGAPVEVIRHAPTPRRPQRSLDAARCRARSDLIAGDRVVVVTMNNNPPAGAVLADPPWPFKTYSSKGEGRSACQHYCSNMTLDEIKAFPVADKVAAAAWLFLWVPAPQTLMIHEVMASWGFAFSGLGFSWVKTTKRATVTSLSVVAAPGAETPWHMALGHTTRKNIEVCWLGRRGNPKRLDRGVRELIVAPVREPSRKPNEIYERIERFCAGPYLELFARQRCPGWISFGDELDRFGTAALEREATALLQTADRHAQQLKPISAIADAAPKLRRQS
jgi:N6-adenosine-specific RNA methylase IME4